MGKGKIILAVIVVVAIAAAAAYFFVFAEKFDHNGKYVTANASELQPDAFEAQGSIVWSSTATTSPLPVAPSTNTSYIVSTFGIPADQISSYQFRIYAQNSGAALDRVEIHIIVLNTVDNAKAAYLLLPGLGTSYGKFEKSEKSADGMTYKFIDMNVIGYVKIVENYNKPTQAQVDKMMSNIENKIHAKAVPIP